MVKEDIKDISNNIPSKDIIRAAAVMVCILKNVVQSRLLTFVQEVVTERIASIRVNSCSFPVHFLSLFSFLPS